MESLKLATVFLKYLNDLNINVFINNWEFIGKTELAYGAAGGSYK
jgi:hypothetical protein